MEESQKKSSKSERYSPKGEIQTIDKDISFSKSTFRIHIYKRQGEYQGKIEHLITKDKKSFKGIDQKTIYDFIYSHLPDG